MQPDTKRGLGFKVREGENRRTFLIRSKEETPVKNKKLPFFQYLLFSDVTMDIDRKKQYSPIHASHNTMTLASF